VSSRIDDVDILMIVESQSKEAVRYVDGDGTSILRMIAWS